MGNPYAGGMGIYTSSSPPADPWTTGSTGDLAFKTYVAPPQATGQRPPKKKCKKHKHRAASAKKHCKKKKK